MELTYTRQGDYLLPDLTLPEDETQIGKYGMLRKTYLKNHRKGIYASLMLSGGLNSHLSEIDRTAQERVERSWRSCWRAAPHRTRRAIKWRGWGT